MEFETPYNHPEIIYEVTDIEDFLLNFKNICIKELLKSKSLNTLRNFNKDKYSDSFIEKLLLDLDIIKTMKIYLIKSENGSFLVNIKLYQTVVTEHVQHICGKILNIIVDDGYLQLSFDPNTEKFIWIPPTKKVRKKHGN